MEEQGFGGWGSPRARAALGGGQGRKDHAVPLNPEQRTICGVGDFLGTCSGVQQQELVAHPYLGLKPWPGLLCLAGDLTIKVSPKACEASGLQGSFRKSFMRHILSWDEFSARAFGCLPVEFCKESTSVFTTDSHNPCWGSG